MSIECSIIIRCFNEEEYIGRLLAGIFEQTISEKEVIVVDSGSTDATLAVAANYPVKIINIKKEEFSFGKSLNMGCSVAGGRLLVFTSAHVYPLCSNWLELLLEPFKDDKVAFVYGKQRGNDMTHFSEQRIFRQWFPETSNFNQNHHFCNNANSAVRRQLWEKYAFSEELTGLEDIDWAKRIMNEGYKVAYHADAEVVHVHEEEYSKIFNRYYREAYALKKISPEEKFGLFDFFYFSVKSIFSDLLAALKEKKFLRWLTDIIIFRIMQFYGTYRGFHDARKKISKIKERFYYPVDGGVKSAGSNTSARCVINYSNIGKKKKSENF